MSWARIDDAFHRNAKQLRMSDAAFRVYVCSLSYCAQERDPTGHLSREQARALIGSLGKGPRVVRELVQLNAWEEVEDGYLIHDFDQYVDRGSVERVRRFRERKQPTRNPDVTPGSEPSSGDVTLQSPPGNAPRASAPAGGNPVPEPVPEDIPPVRDSVSDSPQGGSVTGNALVRLESNEVPVLTTIEGSLLGAPYRRFVAELNAATGREFRGDAESQKLFSRRLAEGRSVDDLLSAARGVALSKHHMGLNDSGIPYNAPANVLRSKVLDQLIALGRGEIGVMREETSAERQERELHEWAQRKAAERGDA